MGPRCGVAARELFHGSQQAKFARAYSKRDAGYKNGILEQ